MPKDIAKYAAPDREDAIALVESALQICDELGLTAAAIHLATGLDFLKGWDQAIHVSDQRD